MSCFDRLGRLIRTNILENHVQRGNVVQSGPSEFVVCHYSYMPELRVYDSDLQLLRDVRCIDLSNICCNSKFVFGLWDTRDSSPANDAYIHYFQENINSEDNEQEKQYSRQRIQVYQLDTLSEVFELRVSNKYTIERIMADEHRVVAISRLASEPSQHCFMSVFDLATCGESAGGFFLIERHIDLVMQRLWLEELFLLDGWLVVPRKNPFKSVMTWFDKNGKRSEQSTAFDTENLRAIYSSSSSLLFALFDNKLLLKPC